MLRKRIITLVMAVVMLGGTAATASLTLIGQEAGGATPVSGQTQIWATLGPGNGNGFKVLFTGAIGDHGTSVGATKNGQPTTKKGPGYRLFILTKGTIFFNTKTIDAAENNNNTAPTTFNKTTCSATFIVTEPVTAIRGTKAYTGITGTIDVTISFAFTLPLDKGKCNPNSNANPSATFGQVNGTGTVSYG